jgi:hypothetical protein
LKGLIDKYPQEDVAVLASDMMKGFQRGLLLSSSSDKMLARGSLFNIRFGESGEAIVSDSALLFSAETKAPHELLLIYPKGNVDDNMLLFTVANYNFGNFMVNDFGLEKSTMGEIGLLRITGFNNQDQVMQYLRKIQQPDGYAKEWEQAMVLLPISVENYNILMKGRSIDEYMTFFEKQFAKGNEDLIAQWRLKQAEEMKTLPETEEKNLLSEAEGKTGKGMQLPEAVAPVDSVQTTFPVDSIPITLPDSIAAKVAITSDKVLDSVNEFYTEASGKVDNISKTLNEIASDPVRGIANLFKRKKTNNAIEEFAKQQEKEEKERQMQLKKEQDEKDKTAKAEALQKEKEQSELLKKKAEEEKAALKAKQQEKNELVKKAALEKKQKEDEKKQKEAEKKRVAKEKKEAREKALKKRQEDQKAKEKARREEQKRKEKEREKLRKQNEKR